MPITQDDARQLLIRSGRRPVAHLGSGMEGHVFDIGDELVAKVWFAKTPGEIAPLQTFYEVLGTLGLPFATPRILEIHDLPGGTVSIERTLRGTPLSDLVDRDEREPPTFATEAVVSVLTALRDHPVPDAQPILPILGIEPLDAIPPHKAMPTLLRVVRRNVERYGDRLRQSVPDFDWVLERTVQQVSRLPDAGRSAVHGDLCPPNVLLGPDRTVSAVVDWGFLSHVGDTTFDATIACGSYNLYGRHYRQTDDYLVAVCADRLRFDCQRLLIHRALYALLTSNAYSEDGTDGHFGWCIGNLNRDDVRAALAVQSR
ncbi:MAG: aminoglycoside phosphotransferase family protein [Chloroflexia bacterium]|nr:aminoglycoside phosphotransferase family protein [Chloroflexia bacterium]